MDVPLGRIDLSDFTVMTHMMMGDPNLLAFEAYQPNKSRRRQFLLMAEDRPQREAWATALNRAAILDGAEVLDDMSVYSNEVFPYLTHT